MNHQRKTLIDRLEQSGKEYLAFLSQLSAEELNRKSAPTEWSLHQCAAHMRDTENHAFLVRVELIRQEAHPAVLNFDQDQWWQTHAYSADESLKKIMAEFRAARRKMVRLLRQTAKKDWDNWARHSAYGKISLDWIAMHAYHHTLEHIHQMGELQEKELLKQLNG